MLDAAFHRDVLKCFTVTRQKVTTVAQTVLRNIRTRFDKVAVFQTAADPGGSHGFMPP